tara:strand:+ start:2165 stop:3565 length:1401 start_codon:yes stop_codon:yes gene_type:complete
MPIRKKDIDKILIIFLFSHLIIWTLVPSITNNNLPLDTIEALAWGSDMDWGFNKHPPTSAFFLNLFYQLFGNQDWVYYLLSQIFVVSSFFIIFKFSEDFLSNRFYSLISILLLEGIYFYNFTTPEFNVNVSQLPFWALSVYYCWKGVKNNEIINWLLFGFFAAVGVLAKYLFVYLLFAVDVFFIYLIINKKFNFKCLISLITFFAILFPHFIWLSNNDYSTITYALHRTGIENSNFVTSHLIYPFTFLAKQIGILVPFFIMISVILSKFKIKLNFKDKKFIFLFIINIVPIVLMFLTSLVIGAKIRTMWMTPYYMFMGVLIVYIFQKKISVKKFKYFLLVFLALFIFSPVAYSYVSIINKDKRTDYPGKEISQIVQKKWDNNFTNEIIVVGGDDWHSWNLSYHLKNRPKWDNIFENKKNPAIKNKDGGFVLIGDKEILQKICNGIFFTVLDHNLKSLGVCMIGKKI